LKARWTPIATASVMPSKKLLNVHRPAGQYPDSKDDRDPKLYSISRMCLPVPGGIF